jgi:hypothetical protein
MNAVRKKNKKNAPPEKKRLHKSYPKSNFGLCKNSNAVLSAVLTAAAARIPVQKKNQRE